MGRLFFKPILVLLFFFSINALAGGAIAGKITIVKGHVFIHREFSQIIAKKNDTVLESDIIEAQSGSIARITMIDSNLIDIYPKTKIEISKYIYRPNQNQKKVELKVDFGKIKSTVNQKYDGAKNTFEVKTPSAVAGVRGTVFTTEYDPVKRVSEVVTIEGLVAVNKMLEISEKQASPIFVKPNHIVNINPKTAQEDLPRELKPEEREQRQNDDKQHGFKYDPRAPEQPSDAASTKPTTNTSPKSQQSSQPAQASSTSESTVDLEKQKKLTELEARRQKVEFEQERQQRLIETTLAQQEEIQRQAEETTSRITEETIKRTEETIDAITTTPSIIESSPIDNTSGSGGVLQPVIDSTLHLLPRTK